MDIIALKGRPISFLLGNLLIICTNTLVGDHFVESDDGGHLVSIDVLGPGRRVLIKRCTQAF